MIQADDQLTKKRMVRMEKKVLVAYASSYGSTQEVAGVVAETLRSQGLNVELEAMRNVRSLDGYGGVVLGAALYMLHWHKDMLRFLSRHQRVLSSGLPCAIFTGGPFSPADEKTWQEVQSHVEKELARVAWLKPVSLEIIGGRFDPAALRFPWSLVPAMRNMPASDLRDWAAIRAWAGRVGPLLLQEKPMESGKNQ
jgi:menaquinone-dependent protoporphyrinogen oxidase